MPQFKVIRASAGSGKTFNLTGEYLSVLFTETDAFLHILAVTFTNKATEEMKSRILKELFLLSSEQPSTQLPGLIEKTGLPERLIRSKAQVILKKLLHRYSSFSVTTIDSFFQRIIRNFTRELGIQEGYAIELDTDLVLAEIIDRLLINAGEDKALLNWLTQFAESLIDKGESWNIRKGIFELGKEIFREEYKSLNEESMKRFADRDFLEDYRKTLHALMSQTEKSYREFGCQGMSIILQNGLAIEDFIYGNDGPAGFFKKLSDGIFAEPLNRSIQASTCAEKWYSKSSPLKSNIQALAIELMPVMQHAIEFYESNNTAYFTAKVILKNLFTLGILIDLSKLADAWCSENNTFLLPEAPVFLNKIIDGNDTPFIYEKAGYWFHHFMIDEFQDTSLMQWLNFKPLISNSLSQNYDNLAVGDTKQSIYRWRNSNWDILESRVHGDFPNGIIDSVTLNENWRSLPEIIRFNNDFFKAAASCLQEAFEQILSKCRDDIRDELQPITGLYAAVEQKPGKPANKGGYVKVEYISNGDDSGFYDEVNSRVVKLINDLLDLGYHMNDIAILTRKNSEAARLADYILENAQTGNKRRIEVISDEALHLNSSVVVNTLIALLQYILDPSDKTNNFYLASFSSNYLSSAPEASWMNPEFKERIPVLRLPQEFHELADTGKSYSLIEITERIIKIFELETHIGESVYLMAFRDMVIDYSKRSGSDVSRFIDYWNESGCERSVSAPAGQDAVRILTLHKSKGLEFKITIIPYCTWELSTYNKSFLWCRPAEEPFNGLPLIPLNFTSLLDKTIFAADYYKEIQKQYIDNLNLMYVAFTRAREAMFVFCKSGEKDQLRTVSDLSRKILGNSLYVRGELASNQMSDQEKIESSPIQGGLSDSGGISSITGRIRIAFQGELLIDPAVSKPSRPLNEGKILHDIFKSIQKRSDIGVAVTTMHLQGKIAADEQAKYISLISHAMNDIQVSTWFTDEWKILNEAEIILPEGIIKRPDRVMFNDRQTLVIDYKFGNKMESSYESQLREYASLLKNMGYKNVEAYLWYVRLGKIISLR